MEGLDWLQDVGSNVNPASWTRKDLSHLLATRQVGEMAMGGGVGDESDSDNVVEYDSEDDGAPMFGPGGARRGGEEGDNNNNDDVDIGVGTGGVRRGGEQEGDDDDDGVDGGVWPDDVEGADDDTEIGCCSRES